MASQSTQDTQISKQTYTGVTKCSIACSVETEPSAFV